MIGRVPSLGETGNRGVIRDKEHPMYTLLRVLSLKRIVIEQLPAFATAWLVAELYYKFHSFSLECAAFLATWFILDALVQTAKHVLGLGRGRLAAASKPRGNAHGALH